MKMSNEEDSNEKRISKPIHTLNLDRVVFIGRTFSEYMGMFNLEPSQLKGLKILDCPSDASSFGAEAYNEYGIKKVVGCDILYDNDGQENALTTAVEKRGKDDLDHMIERLSQVPDLYNWNLYVDIDDLRKSRSSSLRKFISDYAKGIKEKRYIKAQLPNLPFDDKSFDLVLSANLLFYYHDRFDYSFHLDSVLEMLRISSKEIRIFPVQLPDAAFPDYLDTLIDTIKKRMQNNILASIETVQHEFRRGVNKMLVLSHV
jgi:SAM-dependent methyltransferase